MSDNKAIVAKIDRVIPIEGADRIQIALVLGEQCIVSKDWEEGDVGILFPSNLQLSEEFCYHNNLFRNSDLNKDKEKTGFFEEKRRVRAQPFLKVRSDAFFCGKDSVSWTGTDVTALKVGDRFNDLNGKEVCKKYINPKTLNKAANAQQAKKKREVEHFTQHVDTQQFNHYVDSIAPGSLISIQTKKHGTSARSAKLKVSQELNWFQRAINKLLGVEIFHEEKWDIVTGTRRVILAGAKKEQDGFHGSNGFRFEVTEMLSPYLEKGMTIYGEIVGYANGKPIMGTHDPKNLKNKKFSKKYPSPMVYKYGCVEGQWRFHVYRITLTTEAGTQIDLTQPQLVKWCKDRGIEHSIDLIDPFVYDGSEEQKEWLKNKVVELGEREELLTEDFEDPSHISEGVIVRVDTPDLTPKFYKYKSFAFKVLEGIAVEQGEVDEEDAA